MGEENSPRRLELGEEKREKRETREERREKRREKSLLLLCGVRIAAGVIWCWILCTRTWH